MGLYDDEHEYDDNDDKNNDDEIGKALVNESKKGQGKKAFKMPKINKSYFQYALYAFIGIIFLVAIYFAYSSYSPSIISYKINPNPTMLKEGAKSKLTVTIKNTNDYDLENVKIKVIPLDSLSIAAIPSDTFLIPILGTKEVRSIDYELNLIGEVIQGDYKLLINAQTDMQEYKKEVFWKIEKAGK